MFENTDIFGTKRMVKLQSEIFNYILKQNHFNFNMYHNMLELSTIKFKVVFFF